MPETSSDDRYVIVGAGIVGLATARRLTQLIDPGRVTVIEKESGVAQHQTGHNSGVVHAGLYYKPGSLKARLCTRGRGMLREFCAEHEIEYLECGKLVVARNDEELPKLKEIHTRAEINGVPGLRWLNGAQMRAIEPGVAGVAGVHSPLTAVVDFREVAHSMLVDLRGVGAEVRLGETVKDLRRVGGVTRVVTDRDELPADHVVICAGLQADRVARRAGDQRGPQIVPFRGEYYRIPAPDSELVRGLIYPVPDPRFPFLGVHFTRRVDGTVDIGPNAVLALSREGYRWRDIDWHDLAEMAAWPGLWKVARRYWRTARVELHGSISKRGYISRAAEFVPDVRNVRVLRAGSGVRAQAVSAAGDLLDDFVITRTGSVVSVRNAPSPAATSSLAIAEEIVNTLLGDGAGTTPAGREARP